MKVFTEEEEKTKQNTASAPSLKGIWVKNTRAQMEMLYLLVVNLSIKTGTTFGYFTPEECSKDLMENVFFFSGMKMKSTDELSVRTTLSWSRRFILLFS